MVDEVSSYCENRVSMFGQVPNDSYAYSVVNTDEYFDFDDLVNIVYETLSKN